MIDQIDPRTCALVNLSLIKDEHFNNVLDFETLFKSFKSKKGNNIKKQYKEGFELNQ